MRTSEPIDVHEIIKALRELGGKARAKEIKDKVTSYRGGIPPQYKTPKTFRETIQRKIEDHCPQSKDYSGKPYFIKIDWGIYELNKNLFKINLDTD
jgi:5-methylcytosine-specific restriction enzyme A